MSLRLIADGQSTFPGLSIQNTDIHKGRFVPMSPLGKGTQNLEDGADRSALGGNPCTWVEHVALCSPPI